MVLGPHCVVIGHTATGHSHTGRTLGSERSTEADCCTQDVQDDGLKQHWGASWDKLVRLDCPEHHSPFLLLIPRFERTPQLTWPQPSAVSSTCAKVVGGGRECRGWGREKVPLGPTLPAGWLTHCLSFAAVHRTLQREEHSLSLTSLVSEHSESTIPSRCRW